MSDLKLPGDDERARKNGPSRNRIIIWIIVGGVGLYLLLSGIVGIVQAGA